MSWSRRLPLPSRCRTSLASLSTFPSLSQCTPRPPARPVHASPRRGLGFLSDLSQTLTGTPLRPQDILGQGRGLRPSLPPNALDSLVDRLERAYSASTLRPSLPSLSDDALLLQQWGYTLRRLPCVAQNMGGHGLHRDGLFLTAGRVQQGAVITLYPGVLYQLPYDVEGLLCHDDHMLGPCPPPFLTQNPYILRFHDSDKNSHLLVDGNPTGRSAMNFIKACMRGQCRQVNFDWLDSAFTSGTNDIRALCGGEPSLLPELERGYQTNRYFSAHLGLGYLVRDVASHPHATSLQGLLNEDEEDEDGNKKLDQDEEVGEEEQQAANVDFHLCALPPSLLPKRLGRYVPNVHYSDLLDQAGQYTVLVTASRDLEVVHGPIELLVAGVHRYGFPTR